MGCASWAACLWPETDIDTPGNRPVNALCYGAAAASVQSSGGPRALTVGSPDQPVTLTAGETQGDGFTVCWWSRTDQPTASGTVVRLEVDSAVESRNLRISLDAVDVRVSYSGGDHLAFSHGLSPPDWSVAHHWCVREAGVDADAARDAGALC